MRKKRRNLKIYVVRLAAASWQESLDPVRIFSIHAAVTKDRSLYQTVACGTWAEAWRFPVGLNQQANYNLLGEPSPHTLQSEDFLSGLLISIVFFAMI